MIKKIIAAFLLLGVFTNLFAVLLMALIGIGSMGAFAWAVLNS